MSIFGAMTTAISGLSAQSTAFSNIGDNLANTQTVGYKGVGTTFSDFVSASTLQFNGSDAVAARPDYQNSVQGSITQSNNPLDVAISGQGFFPVSLPGAVDNGQAQQFTREGDFKLDANGYLVNATGHVLNGWPVDANGVTDQTRVIPLQVGQSGYAPVKTSTATLAANLPATPASAAPATTELPVYDALGTRRNLELSWTPTATPNVWSLSIAQQGAATPLGTVNVSFGAAGNAAAPAGTISGVTNTSGTATGSTYAAGQNATVSINANFGYGAQPISIDLGTFGGTNGVTQFAGTNYNLVSLSQNGVQPGSFSGVAMRPNGQVVVNYDNGSSRVLAQVPLVTFAAADNLQRQDGQAFSATRESGSPRLNQVGTNGSGTLVVSSVEASNVDIATEFTKLIVAQRAYSANTKMVTTADELLQQTIDMKR